jgi:polysaccharide export outer membrane protein
LIKHQQIMPSLLNRVMKLITALRQEMERCGSCAFLAPAAAALLVVLASGCSSPAPGPIPPEWKAQTPGTLAPGDVLKLTFSGATELNQSQKIRADGKVSLPVVGEVQAGGKRLGELQRQLSDLYRPQLKNSEVVVALESTTTAVYVGGAVTRPGKVVLERPMTALEAIMEAGGFVPDLANPRKVSIIRNVNGQHTTHVVDLSPGLRGKSSEAFYLKAFDVVYVPQSGIHF